MSLASVTNARDSAESRFGDVTVNEEEATLSLTQLQKEIDESRSDNRSLVENVKKLQLERETAEFQITKLSLDYDVNEGRIDGINGTMFGSFERISRKATQKG